MNPLGYLKTKGLRRAMQVIWRYKLPKLQVVIVARITRGLPLEDKIVIESHNDFDCNGGAFYDWLIANGYNKRIKIVWRLYHKPPADLPDNVSCVPVYGPSWKKAWALCTAKWLTADCVVADKVRDDQVSLYMTHGIFGLKNAHGLLNVPPSVDYVLSPSPAMDETIEWYRGVDKSHTELVHVGFPELDRLYCVEHSANYEPVDAKGLKTVLWMPTFRQGASYARNDADGSYPYGVPLVNTRQDLELLGRELESSGVHLIIKLHPRQDLSHISCGMPSEITFLTGEDVRNARLDNYDLMLDADAMISDYSGAVFEYLVLDRPIAFVLADLEQYRLGLVPNAERYMAGEKVMDFDGLLAFIRDVGKGLDTNRGKRESFLRWFYRPSDAHSCERVADLFGIAREPIAGDKKGKEVGS